MMKLHTWTKGRKRSVVVVAVILLCAILLVPLLLNFSAVRAALLPGSSSGSLTGTVAQSTADVNLTKEGTGDWAHWGLRTAKSFNHKKGIKQQISNYTRLGKAPVKRYFNNPNAYSWIDGTPRASTLNTTTGIWTYGVRNGFQITVPADTTSRTLKLYVGVWRAQGKMKATVSGEGTATYNDASLSNISTTKDGVYTFTYKAASSGQKLTVAFMVSKSYDPFGNVTLQSATLSTTAAAAPTPTAAATATLAPMPSATATSAPKPTATSTPASKLTAWSAFDGGGQRSGVNTAETTISPTNVGNLTRRWQQALPSVVDGAPAELPNVTTAAGVKNLLFVTTKVGSLLAIDAATGNQVWRKDTTGPNFTTSSAAIDPSGQFVYGYGLDGKVHKYAVGSGAEVTTGGWPVTITLMPNVEKGSSPLNVGNGYLYMTTSGYPGDGGHYQGHVVAVNLSTGKVTVFNSLCGTITQLLGPTAGTANYCPDVQSGIWSRGGAVVDPVTGNVFVTTGNGNYNLNTGGHNYGDTVIELSPDLTKVIDTYTPNNFAMLQANDADIGSASPVMLPKQGASSTPYMAVQAGKDNTLRLLNRQNLSGQGSPNHVGGELQAVNLPQGCDVDTHPVAWTDGNNVTWVYVANFCGLSAFRVVTDGAGHSSLQFAYRNGNSGSSPFIANGVLFVQGNGVLHALNPITGAVLWNSTQASAGGSIGSLHWQSPIVVNGQVYVPDNSGQLSAYVLKGQ